MLALNTLLSTAFAKDKVVVIPLFGDDAKPTGNIANVVTVAKKNGDYLDVLTAMASIKDASESNPYLMVIGPGEYAITETLFVKSYVNIIGSGEDVTELIMRAPNQPTLAYRDGYPGQPLSLSNLTIRNSVPGASNCIAIQGAETANISDVTLVAEGCSVSNTAFDGMCHNAEYTNITFRARASGGAAATGATSCFVGVNIEITNSSFDVAASTGTSTGFYGELELRNSVINSYSNGLSYGVRLAAGSPKSALILNSDVSAEGNGTSIGIDFFGGTALIKHSTVSGCTNSITGPDGAIFNVSHSTLVGSAAGAGNTSLKTCVFTDNGIGAALPSDCVE